MMWYVKDTETVHLLPVHLVLLVHFTKSTAPERYFWYFFGTFYHFVLLRTLFGEKFALFLREMTTANAKTTKSTALERYFW